MRLKSLSWRAEGVVAPLHADKVARPWANQHVLLQYGVLIRLLAEAGYTVISTPYAVTFKHTDCAEAVQEVPPLRRM